jgi:hypothetical protein
VTQRLRGVLLLLDQRVAGSLVSKVAKRLGLGRPFDIGQNVWYLIPGELATGVLKVHHGVAYEIGIADKQLTGSSRRKQRSFIASLQ